MTPDRSSSRFIPVQGSERGLLVDEIDHDRVASVKWYLSNSGRLKGFCYFDAGGTQIPLRCSVTVPDVVFGIDKLDKSRNGTKPGRFSAQYANGDTFDNRRENLIVRQFRPLTTGQSKLYASRDDFTDQVGQIISGLGASARPFVRRSWWDWQVGSVLMTCQTALTKRVVHSVQARSEEVTPAGYYTILVLPDDVAVRSDWSVKYMAKCAEVRESALLEFVTRFH